MKPVLIAVFTVAMLTGACSSDPQSGANSQSGSQEQVASIAKQDPPTAAGPKALCLGFPDKCRR
jgi:hypothetical protein